MRHSLNPVQSWLLGDLPVNNNQDVLASSRWLLPHPSSARGNLNQASGNSTTRSSPALVTPFRFNSRVRPVKSVLEDPFRETPEGSNDKRHRIVKLEVKIAQRDRMIATLQSTVRNLSAYIRQLEQLNEVPENGSLGGTADTSRRVVGALPSQSLVEFTPRMRLNQVRDLNKQSVQPPVTVTSPMASSDDIDEAVQKFLESRDMVGALRRLSYGVYTVGEGPKRISICIKNNKPLVRSGGGSYLHLDMYLSTH